MNTTTKFLAGAALTASLFSFAPIANADVHAMSCFPKHEGGKVGSTFCDDGRPFRVKLVCRNADGGRFFAMGPHQTVRKSFASCTSSSVLETITTDRSVPNT